MAVDKQVAGRLSGVGTVFQDGARHLQRVAQPIVNGTQLVAPAMSLVLSPSVIADPIA